MTGSQNTRWQALCAKADLVPDSGVCALWRGQQIALFYIPGYGQELFAIGNNDPFSGANVLARGIVGDLRGQVVVASPIYKQHFSLTSGICLEDESVRVPVFAVRLRGEVVELMAD